MPATVVQTPIPVPTPDNLLQVVAAIRNALITQTNTDAGRADSHGTVPPVNSQLFMHVPASFAVQKEVIVPVTYTDSNGDTVVVNQLISLTMVNRTTGQTWIWNAPSSLTQGGVVGQPVS